MMQFHITKGDVDLVASKSRAVPSRITVLIVGPTQESVTGMIEEVMDASTDCCFMTPIQCPDGDWSSFGRVNQ
jgi:hypothetical protein